MGSAKVKVNVKIYCLMQTKTFLTDDGTGPDKVAHISGPPDRCEHAAQIINDLLQSIRVREEGQGVWITLTHIRTHFHSLKLAFIHL